MNYCYTEERHQMFAELSGDYNPLHIDPVAARRTIVGSRAVHGVHQTLAAIEAILGWFVMAKHSKRKILGFKSQYVKAVGVDETVELLVDRVTEEGCRIIGRLGDEIVCKTTFRFGDAAPSVGGSLPPLVQEPVIELKLVDIINKSGTIPLGLDSRVAGLLFPMALDSLGEEALAATLALSRLIGMHCPGLHSIFGEANVDYDQSESSPQMAYQVTQVDERFGRVTLSISGGGLKGELIASLRPPPVPQAEMSAVKKLVLPGEFKNSVALIAGGSRGLGEVTARLIAAGGGLPIITYQRGALDAEKVSADIIASGGRCKVLQYDTRNDPSFFNRIFDDNLVPNSFYYFATPKIFGRRRGFFDYELLRDFQEVYVTAFGRLLDRLIAICPEKLRVLYPSSIAVSESLRAMAEYAMAKRSGEELCAYYNSYSKVEIIVERLPRIQTDQTSSVTNFQAADALDVMIPLVRRIEGNMSK